MEWTTRKDRNMNRLNQIISGLAFAGALFSGQAMAASDGTMGTTSTGTSLVTLTVSDRVQITSVADIALGAFAGTGNMVGQSTYCVHRNGGTNYKVNLTDSDGAYTVTSFLSGGVIPFTVKVDDDLLASDGEALTYGVDSAVALVGSVSATCSGADNASIEVTLLEANLQAAPTAADYLSTITILVSPI